MASMLLVSGNVVPGFSFSSSVARLYTLRLVIRPHAVNAFAVNAFVRICASALDLK